MPKKRTYGDKPAKKKQDNPHKMTAEELAWKGLFTNDSKRK